MNPKVIRWALAASLAANLAAVGFWVRGREREAVVGGGLMGPVGRYMFARDGASFMRGDTVTGRLELAALVDGKVQLLEVISAQNPPIGGKLPLSEP